MGLNPNQNAQKDKVVSIFHVSAESKFDWSKKGINKCPDLESHRKANFKHRV